MTDDKRTDADTQAGESVQEETPGPDQRPGGTLGRDEGEGKPGPADPGTTRDVTGA